MGKVLDLLRRKPRNGMDTALNQLRAEDHKHMAELLQAEANVKAAAELLMDAGDPEERALTLGSLRLDLREYAAVIEVCRDNHMPFVCDGDAVFWLIKLHDTKKGE